MKAKIKRLMGFLTILTIPTIFIVEGCASKDNIVAQKPGALLWGENCVRCHNAPSPKAFSDVEWETIGMHMSVRANLTDEEVKKVVAFLKMAN